MNGYYTNLNSDKKALVVSNLKQSTANKSVIATSTAHFLSIDIKQSISQTAVSLIYKSNEIKKRLFRKNTLKQVLRTIDTTLSDKINNVISGEKTKVISNVSIGDKPDDNYRDSSVNDSAGAIALCLDLLCLAILFWAAFSTLPGFLLAGFIGLFVILALGIVGMKSNENKGFAIGALVLLGIIALGYLYVYLLFATGGII